MENRYYLLILTFLVVISSSYSDWVRPECADMSLNQCIYFLSNGSTVTTDNNYTTSIAFTGTTTKTLTLSRVGMSDLTANFNDEDTTYSAGTGLDLIGTTFSILPSYFQGLYYNKTEIDAKEYINSSGIPYQYNASGWIYNNGMINTNDSANVTIGSQTYPPNDRLEIIGYSTTNNANQGGIIFSDSVGQNNARISGSRGSSFLNGDLIVETMQGGNMLETARFTQDGYFGVGKDPSYFLDVNGSAQILGQLRVQNYTQFLNTQGTSILSLSAPSIYRFNTNDLLLSGRSNNGGQSNIIFVTDDNVNNNTIDMILNYQGYLGIGIPSPLTRLEASNTESTLSSTQRGIVNIDSNTTLAQGIGGSLTFTSSVDSSHTKRVLGGIKSYKENAVSGNQNSSLYFWINRNSVLSSVGGWNSRGGFGVNINNVTNLPQTFTVNGTSNITNNAYFGQNITAYFINGTYDVCNDRNNCLSNLNEVTILPFNYTVVDGTETVGNLSYIHAIKDNLYLNVTESGRFRIILRFNLTYYNLTTFSSAYFREKYIDSTGTHNVNLYLQECDGTWENGYMTSFSGQADYSRYDISVDDPTSHICDGIVNASIYHETVSSNPTHFISLDGFWLKKGIGVTSSTVDTSSFVTIDGSRNITVGTNNFEISGNIKITNLSITTDGENTTIKVPTGKSLLFTDDSHPFLEMTQGDQLKIRNGGSIVYPDGTTQNTEENTKFLTNDINASNTTFTAYTPTGISFDLQANKNYTFRCNIIYLGDGATTGIRVNFTNNATNSLRYLHLEAWSSATAKLNVRQTTYASLVATGSAGPSLEATALADGFFNTTSTGTFALSFTTELQATNWTIMRAGSGCTLYTT